MTEGGNYSDMIVGDEETISVDYSNVLPAGVTITGGEWTNAAIGGDTQNGADAMFVDGTIGTVAGAVVSIRLRAIVPNAYYRPRCLATLSDGQLITLPDHGFGSLRTVP